MSLLCTCCTSLLVFISSNFQAPASAWPLAFLTALQHPRVAVLELVCHQPRGKCLRQFKTWLAAHLRMLRGWVEGGPSQRVVLLGRQSE